MHPPLLVLLQYNNNMTHGGDYMLMGRDSACHIVHSGPHVLRISLHN